MTDTDTASTPKPHVVPTKRFRRVDRPERIVIGGETFVRNDILAAEMKCNVRTLNRGDPDGAPYIYLFNVKYRPLRRYHQYLLDRKVVRRGQPPERRQLRKAR
jgi:hypothetical protein